MIMKKFLIVVFICIFSMNTYSQEHIKFNGATFGKPLNEFLKGFPPTPMSYYDGFPTGFNPELCNHTCYLVKFNSINWKCHIFSSKTSNTVFRTVSVMSFTDLKNNLMLLVKALEEKYGGGIQEKQENLGEISTAFSKNREMLALYYYIKGTNNRKIGEIRISAAPSSKDMKSGFIELSYTDYNARDKATKEYNSIMRDAL